MGRGSERVRAGGGGRPALGRRPGVDCGGEGAGEMVAVPTWQARFLWDLETSPETPPCVTPQTLSVRTSWRVPASLGLGWPWGPLAL